MSLAHVRLLRTRDAESLAEYRVESPDLVDSEGWAALGILLLDKSGGRYEFLPAPLWIEKRGIPPSVFFVEKQRRDAVLAAEYPHHGWGAWAMIIHHYAMALLEKGSYPESYPPVFFPEG